MGASRDLINCNLSQPDQCVGKHSGWGQCWTRFCTPGFDSKRTLKAAPQGGDLLNAARMCFTRSSATSLSLNGSNRRLRYTPRFFTVSCTYALSLVCVPSQPAKGRGFARPTLDAAIHYAALILNGVTLLSPFFHSSSRSAHCCIIFARSVR